MIFRRPQYTIHHDTNAHSRVIQINNIFKQMVLHGFLSTQLLCWMLGVCDAVASNLNYQDVFLCAAWIKCKIIWGFQFGKWFNRREKEERERREPQYHIYLYIVYFTATLFAGKKAIFVFRRILRLCAEGERTSPRSIITNEQQ